MNANTKKILMAAGGGVAALALLFSGGVRNMLQRQRELAQAKATLSSLEKERDALKERIRRLEKDPEEYEAMVRRDLRYLRPGEKEIRFLEKRKNG